MEEKLGRPLAEYEQVHHKNEIFEDNDPDNLEIELFEIHQSMHSRKYFDTIAVCKNCNKPFLWSAKSQKYFYGNLSRKNRTGRQGNGPFCSTHCARSYSRNGATT